MGTQHFAPASLFLRISQSKKTKPNQTPPPNTNKKGKKKSLFSFQSFKCSFIFLAATFMLMFTFGLTPIKKGKNQFVHHSRFHFIDMFQPIQIWRHFRNAMYKAWLLEMDSELPRLHSFLFPSSTFTQPFVSP